MTANYPLVDSVESFEKALAQVRAAQKTFATYTQEQVDQYFPGGGHRRPAGRAFPWPKWPWRKRAWAWWRTRSSKTTTPPSTFTTPIRTPRPAASSSRTTAYGITRIAEPIGVIAAVIPTTNPTSTAIFKTLIALKTRNGIIISPHPRAKELHHRRGEDRAGGRGEGRRP